MNYQSLEYGNGNLVGGYSPNTTVKYILKTGIKM